MLGQRRRSRIPESKQRLQEFENGRDIAHWPDEGSKRRKHFCGRKIVNRDLQTPSSENGGRTSPSRMGSQPGDLQPLTAAGLKSSIAQSH
jgi:hypothetical protein